NGAVAEHEIRPVGVPAAEAPGVLQDLNPRGTAVAQRPVPASGVVDVPSVIGDIAVDGRMHSAAPARAEVTGTLLLPGFADGDGVARAVMDLGHRRRPVGPEGPGSIAGRVARSVVGGEVAVEQVVAAPLAGAGIGPVSPAETVVVERGRVLVRRAGVHLEVG